MNVSPLTTNIYSKAHTPELDAQLFKNPTAEYRGTPFWAWNNRLDESQLLRQIEAFRDMGFGGFHIHPRTGLETPYLGEEYMGMVRSCVQKAKSEKMLAWLYDEDRWPSGFGGGLVTCDPQFRARHLLWTCRPYGSPDLVEKVVIASAKGGRTNNGTLIARFEVIIEDGLLRSYRQLANGENATRGREWFAYLEVAEPTSWFNGQTYVDTLNPAAMRRFLETTHERYFEAVGEDFGDAIPAIFTDEPQFIHKQFFHSPNDTNDLVIPFTDDLLDTFENTYGQKLENHLPELFWQLPANEASLIRYRFHDHVAERFSQAYADQIGVWCDSHGIALTGHMMAESTLAAQVAATGEAMRSYRSFTLPGIDLLSDVREYNTAKQAQSAAHQFGRAGVTSELYGVTHWDFPFWGHKSQGDWQAALGVTVRVPHLAWGSMAGEAKRDYPASISYQSTWYQEYPLIEDHFARLNTVLTRGKAVVRVGVIHPIESFWLDFGPVEQTKAARGDHESRFTRLTDWLLFGLLDFDFIAESLLPELSPKPMSATFDVGEMAYDVVLVPALRTIRSSTLERLESFVAAGGRVVFVGEIPSLVDAKPSDQAKRLADQCACVPFERGPILGELADFRELHIKEGAIDPLYGKVQESAAGQSLLYQLRQDGERRYLFICNAHRTQPQEKAHIRLNGTWKLTFLDTFSGEKRPFPARLEDGDTTFDFDFPAHGHLLLELEKGAPNETQLTPLRMWKEKGRLLGPNPITLSEPNVLMLDQARFRLGEGSWQNTEEILRIENIARTHWGLPAKDGNICQPWADTEPSPVIGTLSLSFSITSDIDVKAPRLALENAADTEIYLEGARIPSEIESWWVDEAIQTVPLPDLMAGTHELELRLSFTRKTNVEWCYLLGDFGVQVRGSQCKIIAPVRELFWGDWTTQGLPFYAGNVTYHCTIDADETETETALRIPHFNSPLLSLKWEDQKEQKIAFAPFRAELVASKNESGSRKLDITAFGNRINAFGAVHSVSQTNWCGPDVWRSTGDDWAYEYSLRPMGILHAPLIETLESSQCE